MDGNGHSDFFLWRHLLNSSTEEGEWFWRDFRDKVFRLRFQILPMRNLLPNFSSCGRYLWDWLCPDKPCPPLESGCDHQNRPHHPQRKPSFMASLLAGDLAATATITAAPTALVVRGDSPPLPPPLRLQPLTMPWPSPTPTYTSSVCHHGQGRKRVSCCLYRSSWAAVALVPRRPLFWCCTGTRQANDGKGCPGADRWGPTWQKPGLKLRGGRLPCSVYSEMWLWLLTQVRMCRTRSGGGSWLV